MRRGDKNLDEIEEEEEYLKNVEAISHPIQQEEDSEDQNDETCKKGIHSQSGSTRDSSLISN